MKIGFRKRSFKKSLKARTTGKVKRSLKKSFNPFYGKKGMGFIKNPSRSIKNKMYHKATVGMPYTGLVSNKKSSVGKSKIKRKSSGTRKEDAVYMWSCGEHCINHPICSQFDGCVVTPDEMAYGRYVPGEWRSDCDCVWVKLTGDNKPEVTGFPEIITDLSALHPKRT